MVHAGDWLLRARRRGDAARSLGAPLRAAGHAEAALPPERHVLHQGVAGAAGVQSVRAFGLGPAIYVCAGMWWLKKHGPYSC